MDELGLPWELFTPDGLEFYDQVNFLKAGLAFADALTTVSPTYAEEIQTPELGCGPGRAAARARTAALHGILNGIDAHEWNPATDPLLPARYNAEDSPGKARVQARSCSSASASSARSRARRCSGW